MTTLELMIFHAIVYVAVGSLMFAGFLPGYGLLALGERLQRVWLERIGWTIAFVGWIAGNAALALIVA